MITYLSAIGYSILFLLAMKYLRFFKAMGLPYSSLVWFFILKLIAGEIGYLLYTYHPSFQFTSDAFRFFRDGGVIYQTAFTKPGAFFTLMTDIPFTRENLSVYINQMPSWYREFQNQLFNDSRFLVRFNALIWFLSQGNYLIHIVIANILSFIGLLHIYRFFNTYTGTEGRNTLLFGIFCVPSILFWGSMVSKESLSLFALGLSFAGITLSMGEKQYRATYTLLPGLLLLLAFKIYLFAVLIIVIIPLIYSILNTNINPKSVYLYSFLFFGLCCFFLHVWIPAFDPVAWILQRQKDFFRFAAHYGDIRGYWYLIPSRSATDLLIKAPLAWSWTIAGLFFPPVYQVPAMAALFENLFLLAFVIQVFLKKSTRNLTHGVVLFCLVFFVIDFQIIGWTTPYAGAIHRFRIFSILFIFCGLSIIIHQDPFKKIFRYLPFNFQKDE